MTVRNQRTSSTGLRCSALLLSGLAVLMAASPAMAQQAPARQTLGGLYKYKSDTSCLYLRTTYAKHFPNFQGFYGDLNIDRRSSETLSCNLDDNILKCIASSDLPSAGTINRNNVLPQNKLGNKVGVVGRDAYGKREDLLNDIGKIRNPDFNFRLSGAKQEKGRLWSYVWDFDSDRTVNRKEEILNPGCVGLATENEALNYSFYAKLPNGNPVEIKLNNVLADAFVMGAFRGVSSDAQHKGVPSPKWNKEWNVLGSLIASKNNIESKLLEFPIAAPTSPDNNPKYNAPQYLEEIAHQGACDADGWSTPTISWEKNWPNSSNEIFRFWGSGVFKDDATVQKNNARACYEEFTSDEASELARVPLYINPPEFDSSPQKLGKVSLYKEGKQCVYPILKKTALGSLEITGLGSRGKAEIICEPVESDKKVAGRFTKELTVSDTGTASLDLSAAGLENGVYHCSIYRADLFEVAFVDAEQVGGLRMYEVRPDGKRVPLSLNWDDKSLNKIEAFPTDPPLTRDQKQQKIYERFDGSDGLINSNGVFLSAPHNQLLTADLLEHKSVRSWGHYLDGTQPDNKKFGMGNADVVTTWTYYPTSERHYFAFEVTDDAARLSKVNEYCDGSESDLTDTDGDGIPDLVEGKTDITGFPDRDTDGDGKPDFDDTDSDGDGIPDNVECNYNPVRKGFGFVYGCEDTDEDGIPDYLDTDSDNDGIPDKIECPEFKGKGVNGGNYTAGCYVSDPGADPTPDYRNPDAKTPTTKDDSDDADGDGISNEIEGYNPEDPSNSRDTDEDGIPDYLDLDSDNDGIPDSVEARDNQGQMPNGKPVDTDGDKIPDYLDTDSDNDKKHDSEECIYNPNLKGIHYVNGCYDKEASGTPDYRNKPVVGPSWEDTDGDGIPDDIEGYNPDGEDKSRNTDGADNPDYNDTDSDGDGIPDSIECNYQPYKKDDGRVNGCKDTDGDGVPDYLDADDDGDGIPTKKEAALLDKNGDGVITQNEINDALSQTSPEDRYKKDTDGDKVLDYLDPDDDGDGIPTRIEVENAKAFNLPGPDQLDSDGDGKPDYLDLNSDDNDDDDSDNDGKPDSEECKPFDDTQVGDNYYNGCYVSNPAPGKKPDYLNKNEKGNGGDTDGDGIPDAVEKKPITDKDGNSTDTQPNDKDSDGDGIPDDVECQYDPRKVSGGFVDGCRDTDGDGIPDYRDTDDDNDGIPTKTEAAPLDKDDDGIISQAEIDAGIKENDPDKRYGKDTDGDGIPDFRDNDDDGDGIPTKVEVENAKLKNDGKLDTDGDSKPDYLDTDSDGDNLPDANECKYDENLAVNNYKGCTSTSTDSQAPDYLNNSVAKNNNPGGNGGPGGKGNNDQTGFVAGGCASTPSEQPPAESWLLALLGGIFFLRRRRKE